MTKTASRTCWSMRATRGSLAATVGIASLMAVAVQASGSVAIAALKGRGNFARLEKTLQAEMARRQTPGVAIALIKDGKVVYAKGFGVESAERATPVTGQTLFRIGSTTKIFTAALLTSLAHEGKLDLDAPIGAMVPELPDELKKLTPRQLLSHTGGLLDRFEKNGGRNAADFVNQTATWTAENSILTAPGEVFSYSNPAFNLAGIIAERVCGTSYCGQIAQRFFGPLGMAEATFDPLMASSRSMAQAHLPPGSEGTRVVRPVPENTANNPCGGIFSSVKEMARFACMFQSGGVFEGKQVVAKEVLDRMAEPHADLGDVFPVPFAYGLGLMIQTYRGQRMLAHNGAFPGYAAQFAILPDHNAGVVILANSGATMPETLDTALGMLAPLGPRPPPPEVVPVPEEEIKQLVGTYGHGPNEVRLLRGKRNELVAEVAGLTSPVVRLKGEKPYYGLFTPLPIPNTEISLAAFGRVPPKTAGAPVPYIEIGMRMAKRVEDALSGESNVGNR